jgi:hypothetical protein
MIKGPHHFGSDILIASCEQFPVVSALFCDSKPVLHLSKSMAATPTSLLESALVKDKIYAFTPHNKLLSCFLSSSFGSNFDF